MATANGRIIQVIGSTFDAEFDEGFLPDIYNALKVDTNLKGIKINLTGEVQQQLGGNRVRCVALGSTDGLVRGMPVTDTGGPVTVPVGRALWPASSIFWANRSTVVARSRPKSVGQSTVIHQNLTTCHRRPKSSRQASRWLTF